MRAAVRPGNSGGPAVDAGRRRARDRLRAAGPGSNGGYGVPMRFVDAALAAAGTTALTPPCVK